MARRVRRPSLQAPGSSAVRHQESPERISCRMPIVDLTDFLRYARATGTTVPGVAVNGLTNSLAAIATAEALASPVVVSATPQSFADVGIDSAMAAVERFATRASVAIPLQLAGVRAEQELVAGIRLGFCGVSLAADVSSAMRAELTAVAGACGIAVWSDDADRGDPDPGAANGVECLSLIDDTADLEAHIRRLGTDGRSREFVAECRAWTPVEHVVEFNAEDLTESQVVKLLDLGTRLLGSIPGVRDVRTGRAAAENARYRYGWFMRFAAPAVIESFNKHPVHVAFADGHFRPIAKDRLTTNYVMRAGPESDRATGGD
jgi:hypothetical protein